MQDNVLHSEMAMSKYNTITDQLNLNYSFNSWYVAQLYVICSFIVIDIIND